MSLRVRFLDPSGAYARPEDMARAFDRFVLEIWCDECGLTITEHAWAIWSVVGAWRYDGATPLIVHASCRDAALRSRFSYDDRFDIRMRPLPDLPGQLSASLTNQEER